MGRSSGEVNSEELNLDTHSAAWRYSGFEPKDEPQLQIRAPKTQVSTGCERRSVGELGPELAEPALKRRWRRMGTDKTQMAGLASVALVAEGIEAVMTGIEVEGRWKYGGSKRARPRSACTR